jgi:hypothetical protein
VHCSEGPVLTAFGTGVDLSAVTILANTDSGTLRTISKYRLVEHTTIAANSCSDVLAAGGLRALCCNGPVLKESPPPTTDVDEAAEKHGGIDGNHTNDEKKDGDDNVDGASLPAADTSGLPVVGASSTNVRQRTLCKSTESSTPASDSSARLSRSTAGGKLALPPPSAEDSVVSSASNVNKGKDKESTLLKRLRDESCVSSTPSKRRHTHPLDGTILTWPITVDDFRDLDRLHLICKDLVDFTALVKKRINALDALRAEVEDAQDKEEELDEEAKKALSFWIQFAMDEGIYKK